MVISSMSSGAAFGGGGGTSDRSCVELASRCLAGFFFRGVDCLAGALTRLDTSISASLAAAKKKAIHLETVLPPAPSS